MENNEKNRPDINRQMDDLIRSTLTGARVEPPKGLWRGIRRRLLLREIVRLNFTNLSKTLWITGISGLVAGAILIYLLAGSPEEISKKPVQNQIASRELPHGTPGKPSSPAVTGTPSKPGSAAVVAAVEPTSNPGRNKNAETKDKSTETKINDSKSTVPGSGTKVNTQEKPARQAKPSGNPTPPVPAALAVRPALMNPPKSTPANKQSVKGAPVSPIQPSSAPEAGAVELKTTTPAPGTRTELLPALSAIRMLAYEAVPIPVLTTEPPPPGPVMAGEPGQEQSGKIIPQHYSAGFGILPEYTFYRNDSGSYSEFGYWFAADLAYHAGRFYIRPGLSFGVMYDKSRNSISYKSNDSIGYYREVISYSIDPLNPNRIIYTTVNRTVFDSLVHSMEQEIRNRYEYIQIPLMFGFDIVRSPKFLLSIQAGPVVTFLLGSKEISSETIDLTGKTLISSTPGTFRRTESNWQLWGALHMEYRFSKQWSLSFEPVYKYYFKPVAEMPSPSDKSPWSLGLQVGFRYSFGFKNEKP
jgi:hypothetical protein